ncbi:UPF0481 protein At3g47200-like [Chenopodium quinoa]|uniref:UPF0481 protein At3g47200-like n=1 Tax=Chenopodium quinoa TaxID=63459 RepID=UPI000B777DC8|nr:UPF0481 protein At3g47200-like [Chenopodium quinoa]
MEIIHQQSETTILLDQEEILMQKKLESSSSASSDKCCIYKIPEFILKGNEKHYKPSVVSIGPAYYKDQSLETMQHIKWIYLKHFLIHSQNVNKNRGLKDFINYVKGSNGKICGQYQEQIIFPNECNDFVEMVVLDAAFLVYLFLNNWCPNKWPIPINQPGLMPYINKDLYLLENQLPFFVLQDFFDLAFGNVFQPFINFTLAYIHNHTNFPGVKAIHHCMHTNKIDASTINHLLDLMRTCCCLPCNLLPRNQLNLPKDTFPSTAKRLFDAGVKFEVQDSSDSPLNITFEKGKLKIPKLVLDDFTEPYLRSILFFEQCHYSKNSYIIDYIFFLDELIDTVEDVQVLDRSEIIQNDLGSDEDAIKFINKITANVNLECKFYYSGISRDLNEYAKTHWNRWLAILRRNYFNHPWASYICDRCNRTFCS